jgi:hypothetical protein
MRRLPATVEDLAGRRAARWIRESTPGQFDRYGPEAQAELQDRAIERLGLTDSRLAWRAAHSGRTVYRSAEMADMLAAARRGDFEVLLVGYVSRWQRNLRRTLELLEDTLHPAGVPVYFCDEEILSSSERHWDQLVDEAKDAERYSRRLSRRIKEGYASKLVKERDPGGHPPFGFRRNGDKLLEPDPERLPTVLRVFEFAAAGVPDRDVATAVGLPLFTVRGVLTSPLYVGRLRDGKPARWAPLVPGSDWEAAQAKRARRATNSSRPADPRRPYALDMLHCAACGRRLTGDTGYYRHREPCPPFIAARPEHRGRGRTLGHAYRREMYEQIVEDLLAQAAVGASAIAGMVAEVNRAESTPDRFVLDRIARERERSMAHYLRDRDAARLEQSMARLDQEQAAAEIRERSDDIPADVAVRYVQDLPETWRKAEAGSGRQLLASALFDRIDVLGIKEATVHLSAHAVRHGLGAALPGEVGILVSGRGERRQATLRHLHVPGSLPLKIEVMGAERWLRASTA